MNNRVLEGPCMVEALLMMCEVKYSGFVPADMHLVFLGFSKKILLVVVNYYVWVNGFITE